MRVCLLEGGLPDSTPSPAEWLFELGGCLFWAGGGFGGHVYTFAYVCAGCMCVYLYAYIKKSVCTFTYLSYSVVYQWL